MRTTVRRMLGAVLALGLAAGTVTGAASPASAATNPAHSLAAARTHAPLKTSTWVGDALTRSTQQNWYRVVLTRSGYLSVVLGDLPGDYNLALYDDAGTRLRSSDHAGRRFEDVDLPTASAGTYFVRVASTSGSSATEYALRVRQVTAPVGALSVRAPRGHEIYGEWVNNTGSWVVIPLVDLRYYDAAGRLLQTRPDTFVVGNWPYLPPRGRIPFEVFPGNDPAPSATARVTVTPQSRDVPARTAAKLTATVSSVRFPLLPGGVPYLVAKGSVKNGSTRTVTRPTVFVETFTARGVLASLAQDGPVSLAAGATRAFDAQDLFYDQAPRPRYRAVRALECADGV